MRLSKCVPVETDVYVDYELEIDDVIEFIEEASTEDLDRLKAGLNFPEERRLSLFEKYYQEMIEKLSKNGVSPFKIEEILKSNGIIS